jgi:hypothetical protein
MAALAGKAEATARNIAFRLAPIPAVRVTMTDRLKPTLSGPSSWSAAFSAHALKQPYPVLLLLADDGGRTGELRDQFGQVRLSFYGRFGKDIAEMASYGLA